VLEENVGQVSSCSLGEILDGEMPKVTKSAVAEKTTVGCGSLYNWLNEYDLDFEEMVSNAVKDFFFEWRKLRREIP